MDVLVAHERVSAYIPGLHNDMQNGMGIAEVSVQQDSAGHGGGEVENKVRDHCHVRGVTGHGFRPGDVRMQCLSWYFTHVPQIPGHEDGGLEFGIVWIVHGIDGR